MGKQKMTKHNDVALAWSNGQTKVEGSRMFVEGNAIYSYGYHFPIAVRLEDCILFNEDGYSVSTSRHKNMVKAVLSYNDNVVNGSTEKLKRAIELRIKSMAEWVAIKL